MALRTPDEYRESLRDSRTLWFRGERVPDITAHPQLRVAVDHAAIDYEMHEEVTDPDSGEKISRYYAIPRNGDDLMARSRLIEATTAAGGTMVTLIHEIGTDALFALHRVCSTLGDEYLERVKAYWQHCAFNDLAMAVAQTDTKGDRGKGPQDQPDAYLRVVERRPDGVVVRGAKVHTSVSANGNELVVLPTRAMRPGDEDYAIAFAVPMDAPGLSMIISGWNESSKHPTEKPLSSKHKMLETLTVFDDVFVPNDRVFLDGQTDAAGKLALTFVEYHRFTAVSYKLPLLDALVGAAIAIAKANGIAGAGHVRDKVTWLITYAETVRALTEMAASRYRVGELDIAYPDPMTTNIAKFTFATHYHEALERVTDVAGGLLVTSPSGEDWENPELRPVLEKYLFGAEPAEDRMRLMYLIADLVASDFAGYHAVLAVHAEGSVEAEKLQIFRAYDPRPAEAYARRPRR
jgi:aromatic ring hydroxylase